MKSDIRISVDRDFARFGSKAYAINKINSVEVRKRHPHGQGGILLFALLAIICTLGGTSTVLLVLIFGALAVWAWWRSRIVEYQLFLMTSSSEAEAIKSHDPDWIDALRDRIERAMAGRLA